MTDTLKPCPFCGADPVMVDGGPGCFFVHCTECKVSGDDGTEERARDVWNCRAALSRPIDPKAEVEPVAKQWRAVEYGEPRTSWNAPDRGDRRGWQAWAEGHNGYEIEWRDLYASPSIVAPVGVGDRRTAQFWRDDAFQQAAEIATRYGESYIASDILALAKSKPPVPAVKPLDWVDGAPGTYKEIAESPFGHYSVWEINGTACWSPWKAGSGSIVEGGILGAKAAAQADYESRIRSALTPAEKAGVGDGAAEADRRKHVGQGMAIAAAIIVRVWGDDTQAKEILGAAGYNSVADLKRDDIDDYDIEPLAPLLSAQGDDAQEERNDG